MTPPSGAEPEAPRSDLEQFLARIWREVLGEEKVGIHDNFFALGGTSLHMVRLRDRLLADLGHDVRITDFFKYPTIALLVQSLSSPDASADADLDRVDEQVRRQREALLRQKKIARETRGDS